MFGSAGDVGAALLNAAGSVLPLADPASGMPENIAQMAQAAGEQAGRQYAANPNALGTAQASLNAIPIVGGPLSQLAGPSVSVASNRPPTPEENTGAIEGGASLAGMMVAPKIMSKVLPETQNTPVQNAPVETGANVDTSPRTLPPIEQPQTPSAVEPAPEAPQPVETQPTNQATTAAPEPHTTQLPIDYKAFLPDRSDAEFGEALRAGFTGERDTRVAQAQYVANDVKSLVPDPVDQQALTLMRDFKGKLDELPKYLDGSADAYSKLPADARQDALERVQQLRPAIERAMNPTPAMQAADARLSAYFQNALAEAKNLGVVDSSLDPDSYINHLLQPKKPASTPVSPQGGVKVSRFSPFAKERYYPTVLDAIVDGSAPRTINAADALQIYGDKHGTAVGTRMLVNTLKNTDLGKFATEDTAPEGWKEVGGGSRVFKNQVPFVDSEGNPQVANQSLYAPPDVADAIEPLTDPNALEKIPGFRQSRLYQAYIKSAQLSLSIFHVRALNITALNNMGAPGLAEAYAHDLNSPAFRDVEQTFLRSGGTTSITGKTIEAYHEANPGIDPTLLDKFRSLPGIKQLDAGAAATSRLTFDVFQRKFKVTDFAIKDAKWIAKHPEATDAQLAAARRSIAAEVNAAYGGLNWEALGVNKTTQALLRASLLAPDWTFSNWLNLSTAFKGGPAGSAARMFWVRSAATGVVLSQLTSKLLSGQFSKDPTQVYLGKDKKGRDVYQNIFFAGAPQDAINFIHNAIDYGPIVGPGRTLVNKAAPIPRTIGQLAMNSNYFGHEIVPKGAGLAASTVLGVRHAVTGTAPVPFSASNLAQMIGRPDDEAPLPAEYVLTPLTGVAGRRVNPRSDFFARRDLQRAGIMGPSDETGSLATPEGRARLGAELQNLLLHGTNKRRKSQ